MFSVIWGLGRAKINGIEITKKQNWTDHLDKKVAQTQDRLLAKTVNLII